MRNNFIVAGYMEMPVYTIYVTVCVLNFCHPGLQQQFNLNYDVQLLYIQLLHYWYICIIIVRSR